jgi:hypothetical protein
MLPFQGSDEGSIPSRAASGANMKCNHELEKILVGDKRNPYRSDNYVCKNCHKEFRKV